MVAILINACIPGLPSLQQPEQAAAVNIQETDEALAATLAVETLNALPTPTLEPATDTALASATGSGTVSPTVTQSMTIDPNASPTESPTLDPNATATPTGTLETSTITNTAVTPIVTNTGTPSTSTQSLTPSPTETLYARFYGTLPPHIPFGKIKLVNKAKVEVYISLHCTTIDGFTTIIEYPVSGSFRISAPAGKYSYVAWVGGKKLLGTFRLGKNGEKDITIFKDKVTIK